MNSNKTEQIPSTDTSKIKTGPKNLFWKWLFPRKGKKECSYLLEREDVKKLEVLSPCNFLSFSPVIPPLLVIKFPITLLSS